MAAVLVYNVCCISKLRIFLFYGHPWVPLCPDKGGLTVFTHIRSTVIKLLPFAEVCPLKLLLLYIPERTVHHAQQYIQYKVKRDDKEDDEEQWRQWLTVIRLHHNIRKAV